MDATFFWRSTNVGSGIGTNFAGIPFNNAVAGHLSETNFSAQNSRIGFRVDSKLMGWNMLGYLESDFLFNNNSNSFQVGSNSAGLALCATTSWMPITASSNSWAARTGAC